MKYLVLLGRVFYAMIFIMASFGHFSGEIIQHAASEGVPFPSFLVPLSGIMSLLGGLSILIGYKAKLGAWLIILFMLPTTLIMHQFWGIEDPMTANLQRVMFLKNLALIGSAMLIAYFGSGPLSADKSR